MPENQPELSVVVPLFNEGENIAIFYDELHAALATLQIPHEIIFVDDASTDGSRAALQKIKEENPQVRVLAMLRNTKKGGALKAGFRAANGRIIVTLDADLQDDPNDIRLFVEAINAGADVAVGWKKERKDPLHKRIASATINGLCRVTFGNTIHDMNCGLKAYRAPAVKELSLHGSLYRFIPHSLFALGYSVAEIPVNHRARKFGVSKFGFGHRLRGLFDLVTAAFLAKYGDRPLHLFGGVGTLMLLPGIAIDAWLTYEWLQGEKIGDRPLLLLGVLLIVIGMQFVSLGLLGELLIQQHLREGKAAPVREL